MSSQSYENAAIQEWYSIKNRLTGTSWDPPLSLSLPEVPDDLHFVSDLEQHTVQHASFPNRFPDDILLEIVDHAIPRVLLLVDVYSYSWKRGGFCGGSLSTPGQTVARRALSNLALTCVSPTHTLEILILSGAKRRQTRQRRHRHLMRDIGKSSGNYQAAGSAI